MEKICVIIPVFNTEKYLKQCIESVLTQTYSTIEVLLIDDGSTDQSRNICEAYAAFDQRVKVLHQDNRGQASARNLGLEWMYKNSNSHWITFVDSDDWIHPEMLEILYKAAVEYESKISICGYRETQGENIKVYKSQKKGRLLKTEEFYCNCGDLRNVIPWGKLYHRDCFKYVRFPEIRACEDEFVTYKILFEFSEIPVVEAPLYAYFMSANSTMRSPWNYDKFMAIRAFEEQIQYFKKRKFQNALENRIKMYLWGIESQLKEVKKEKEISYKYERMLLKKLKIFLIKRRKQYPFKENITRYEEAFPVIMRIYWYIQGIKYKLKRK